MKTFFISARALCSFKDIVNQLKQLAVRLPKKIGLVSTIQFSHLLQDAATFLQSKGIDAIACGPILGCNAKAAQKCDADAFLYIGSGQFHPIYVAIKTEKDVFILNPLTGRSSKLQKNIIEMYKRKRLGAVKRFLHAERIGIIVSTKPGQCALKNALRFKKELSSKGKECYIFICDELIKERLEDFPFIEAWLNTACPRIADESANIVNPDSLNIF